MAEGAGCHRPALPLRWCGGDANKYFPGSTLVVSSAAVREGRSIKDAPMSNYTQHSSMSDRWIRPRQSLDPTMRRKVHGPIRPMEEPGLLDWLLRRH
jgi:hypothetical protein